MSTVRFFPTKKAALAGANLLPLSRITLINPSGAIAMKSPRKSFSEAITARGINAAKEIANLKRRQRYALTCDRTKVFASTPLGSIPVFGRRADGKLSTIHDINADLYVLKLAALPADPFNCTYVSTPDYVAAWCRLNHLKP